MKFGMRRFVMLVCKTSNMWIGQKQFAEKCFDLYKRNHIAHLGAKDMHLLGIHFSIFTLDLVIACCIPSKYM